MLQPSKAAVVVVRSAAVLLAVWMWSGGPAVAQRSAVQPIEWIVRETNGFCQWPYITPDGESITFSRSSDGQATFQLLIANRDGSNLRSFMTMPSVPSLTRASWSRPHRRIAFTGSGPKGANAGIYVADADGENIRRIPAQGVSNRVMYPSFTPDGRSVVVVDYGAPGGSTLYRIEIESGASTPLTRPSEFLVGMPTVSPDGQLIAFAGQRNEGKGYDETLNQLWILPRDGQPYEVSAGKGRQPDWSPDGRWLAFASTRDNPSGRQAVFVVDRNGRNLTQLTDHSTHVAHPVWAPDGKWLVFAAQMPVQGQVFGLGRITVPPLPLPYCWLTMK
jgi:Tol biopolymer transport system component